MRLKSLTHIVWGTWHEMCTELQRTLKIKLQHKWFPLCWVSHYINIHVLKKFFGHSWNDWRKRFGLFGTTHTDSITVSHLQYRVLHTKLNKNLIRITIIDSKFMETSYVQLELLWAQIHRSDQTCYLRCSLLSIIWLVPAISREWVHSAKIHTD